jgi:hypothetical protein
LKFRDSVCTGCFQRPVCVEQIMIEKQYYGSGWVDH